MKFTIFFSLQLAKTIFKLKRIFREPDTLEFLEERIIGDTKYRFWLGREMEMCDTLNLPEMTNKLMNCTKLNLTKNDKSYEVVPFKYIKTGKTVLGYFSEIKYSDKNIICIYKNGDYCDGRQQYSAKIVFSKGKGEPVLEKFFSGTSSEHVFKISGDFLSNKTESLAIYYVVVDKNGIVKGDRDKENVVDELKRLEKAKLGSISPGFIEEFRFLKDKIDLKKENESVEIEYREDAL